MSRGAPAEKRNGWFAKVRESAFFVCGAVLVFSGLSHGAVNPKLQGVVGFWNMTQSAVFQNGRPLKANEVVIDHGPNKPNQFLKDQTPAPAGPEARTPNSSASVGPVGTPPQTLSYHPSWMSERVITPTEGKTTTLIGNYKGDMKHVVSELKYPKSENFGPKEGGFNLLNVPDNKAVGANFWKDYNEPWLRQATNRRDVVVLMSNPADPALISRGGQATGFGKEVEFMNRLVNEGKYELISQEGKYVPR